MLVNVSMRQLSNRIRAALTSAIMALLVATGPARAGTAAPFCAPGQEPQFVFGFAALSAELGEAMGEPTTCEFADPNGTGDVHRRTTRGLAFWRKATNIPTFTNGSEHWAITDQGLVYWTGDRIDPPGVEPPKPEPSIPIRGDQGCRDRLQRALVLLRDRAPVHYEVTTRAIGLIECVERGSATYVWESPPRFAVGRGTLVAGPTWLASVLAHEACHAKLYRDYAEAHHARDWRDVPYEVYAGRPGEAKCLAVQLDALERVGGSRSEIATVRYEIETGYAGVPVEQRWW